jgi:hypothetical protein
MKINESKSAFICFHFLFRIGTFQWVMADSNKKIFRLRVPENTAEELLVPPFQRFARPPDPVSRKYSTWIGFPQTNVSSNFAMRRFHRNASGGGGRARPRSLRRFRSEDQKIIGRSGSHSRTSRLSAAISPCDELWRQPQRIGRTRLWLLPSPSPTAGWNCKGNARWWRSAGRQGGRLADLA